LKTKDNFTGELKLDFPFEIDCKTAPAWRRRFAMQKSTRIEWSAKPKILWFAKTGTHDLAEMKLTVGRIVCVIQAAAFCGQRTA
jgi:hypothetical protein